MTETLYGFKKVPKLSVGQHYSPQGGMCIMEFVSFLNGGDFSDVPDCVDYYIARYMHRVNDACSDEDRLHLLSVIDRMFHTGFMAMDQRLKWQKEIFSRSGEFLSFTGSTRYRVFYSPNTKSFEKWHLFWDYAHDVASSPVETIDTKLKVLNLILDCADTAMGVEETLPQNRDVIVEMLEKSGIEVVEV